MHSCCLAINNGNGMWFPEIMWFREIATPRAKPLGTGGKCPEKDSKRG